MSEEKTLEPTKKKIEDSRKQGQVATSNDFVKSAVGLITLEGVIKVLKERSTFWVDALSDFIGQVARIHDFGEWSSTHIFAWIFGGIEFSVVFIGGAVVVSTLLTWAQTVGPVVLEKPLSLKLDKLNPANFFNNVFSVKTLTTFLGNIAKSSIISFVVFYGVVESVEVIYLSLASGIDAALHAAGGQMVFVLRLVFWAIFLVSCVDVWIQRRMLLRSLKMSHQEMKEEHKGAEGNHEVKQQIREIGHEMLSGEPGIRDPLRGSNALVVNPTHVAVGLRFFLDDRRVPLVRIKAEEDGAESLIQLAQQNNVPVIRHLWLARTLYETPNGSSVPKETYKTVAAVYKILLELKSESEVEIAKGSFDSRTPYKAV